MCSGKTFQRQFIRKFVSNSKIQGGQKYSKLCSVHALGKNNRIKFTPLQNTICTYAYNVPDFLRENHVLLNVIAAPIEIFIDCN